MEEPKVIFVDPEPNEIGQYYIGTEKEEENDIKYHHEDTVKELRERLEKTNSVLKIHSNLMGNSYSARLEIELNEKLLK